jgi:hypothetical protein
MIAITRYVLVYIMLAGVLSGCDSLVDEALRPTRNAQGRVVAVDSGEPLMGVPVVLTACLDIVDGCSYPGFDTTYTAADGTFALAGTTVLRDLYVTANGSGTGLASLPDYHQKRLDIEDGWRGTIRLERR